MMQAVVRGKVRQLIAGKSNEELLKLLDSLILVELSPEQLRALSGHLTLYLLKSESEDQSYIQRARAVLGVGVDLKP